VVGMGVRGISFFAVGIELEAPHADSIEDTNIIMNRMSLRMDDPSKIFTPRDYDGLMMPNGNPRFLIY
jgi:hypothetical protein